MRLTDYFIELIAYVSYFLKTMARRQLPFDRVKTDILRLFSKSEECLKENFVSREDYDQARFAICAWIDEAILNSSWNGKTQWQREQLQRHFYQTADAGEEFFERLNGLGLHQRQVREIYYFCLTMGFIGRYGQEGDQYLLEQLRTSNLKLLTGSPAGPPSLSRAELFPEAYPSESAGITPQKRKTSFSPFTLVCLGGPVVLLGVLFVVYHFVLSGMGKNLLSMVP